MLKESTRNAKFRDTMNLHRGYKVIDKHSGAELIDCRIYITKTPGNYGYQLRCAIWAHSLAYTEHGNGFGEKTTGCGYDKESASVDSALKDMGWPAQCHGTGEHEAELKKLADYLAGKDNWVFVSFYG